MLFAILLLALTAQPSIDLWAADPLQNVFQDTSAPAVREPVIWSAARGQIADAQIVVRSDSKMDITGLSCSVLKHVGGDASLRPDGFVWHFVEYQAVTKNSSKTPDDELLRKAPADFPDAFSEARQIELPPGKNQPIWVQLRVPESAAAGEYRGEITVTVGEQQLRIPLRLTVYDFVLPEPRLWVTVWIDATALAKHHKMEFGSADYWRLLDRTAKMMHEHHQNVILTSWGLIRGRRATDGKLQLDFALLDRWIDLFLRNGFKRIELTHMGGREHGQWEDKNFVAVTLTCHNEASGKAEQVQLEEWLPMLEAHLREKNWLEKSMIHIADEPTPVNFESWRELSRRVHKAAPSLRRIDAIQTPDLAGDLEVMVPLLSYLEMWQTQYAAAQKSGAELWYYTAWVPQERYPNRLMDYPLLKTRVLHWLNYTTNTTGYLHWGLNQWDVPFDTFAPGDNWIIWPGKDGPRSSIRYEAMRAGIEDYEYLKLLEDVSASAAKQKGLKDFDARGFVMSYAQRAANSPQEYSRDPKVLLNTREEVARAIEAANRGDVPVKQ